MNNIILLSLFIIHYFALRKISPNGLDSHSLMFRLFLSYLLVVIILNVTYTYSLIFGVIVIFDILAIAVFYFGSLHLEKYKKDVFYSLKIAPLMALFYPIQVYVFNWAGV
ncbi:MAG: hypothetical protein HRT95_08650 [Moritella sp.]|uniref:hypothetical protein n=1 Tax=Moritella sp. TaxID=78556 RepID=UPI001D30BEE4|nr:hypothetical protein [Moritella sp.]NQZ50242.1 hypothetical protein [Moritella sp.]